MKYLATWVIDIDDADTPIEAARKAWKLRNNKGSHANVFIIKDKSSGEEFVVDLLTNECTFSSIPVDDGLELKDVVVDMDHAIRSFIAGVENKEEQFVGHNQAYLEQVCLPRAKEALKKYSTLQAKNDDTKGKG